MKVAFYRAYHGGWLDYLVSIMSLSSFSHCELIFTSGECASASFRDRGVRFKFIELGDRWEVVDIGDQFDEAYALAWFEAHETEKYDWFGAVMSLFRLQWKSPNKSFCSGACASALKLYPGVTPGRFKRVVGQYLLSEGSSLVSSKD